MPDVLGPEGLQSEWEIRNKMKSKIAKEYLPMWLREREIEMRQVESYDLLKPKKLPPYRNTWMKPTGKLPQDERIHQALLLYVSDMGLLGAAVNPHEVNFMSKNFQSASLDHVMWFHGKINFNNWLFKYEILMTTKNQDKVWIQKIYKELKIKSKNDSDLSRAIKRGLQLL